jgi:hypothetical protein
MSKIRIYEDYFEFSETGLPFDIKFSFKEVFKYWEEKAQSKNAGEAARAQEVLDKLAHASELKEAFKDVEILKKYEEEIRLLCSDLFPEQLTLNEIKALTLPFMPIYFNPSQRFDNILQAAGKDFQPELRPLDIGQIYIQACVFILNSEYGANINLARSLFMDIPNEQTKAMRHYRVLFNADFTNFIPNENFKPLTQEDIIELLDNFDNVDLWKEKIPPNSFNFEGVSFIILLDVTKEQIISSLKLDLLKKDALNSPEIVEHIRYKMSSLFGIPDLRLGFAIYDDESCTLKSLGHSYWNNISMDNTTEQVGSEAFCNWSLGKIFKDNTNFAISDLDRFPDPNISPTTAKLAKQGLKSYVAAPLVYDNKAIGLLEMASEQPRVLNSIVAGNLEEVVPLFTIAMQRMLDEYETKLEAIVQEKFTAIHPSVSWRFFEAAENLQRKQQLNVTDEIEEIVFKEVSPLYGQSDIKSSSTERNHAIQADLLEQLTLAKKVLDQSIKVEALPILKELRFRVSKFIKQMKKGLSAGHELTVIDFFNQEVYPVFNHIIASNAELTPLINSFNDKLDPKLGMIYNKRKDFEDSVSMINDKVSDYIEKKQVVAQGMFPHYFEKYKTDGVEYNIYIGQSLVNHLHYDPIYLKNLRLWQLQTMCEVERLIKRLKPELPLPLDICSLILVHGNPLSIRFRNDEKQFDVDGAYNIRYEIVKKRIDKAYIRGTQDRLTVPNKIAIVYSQDKEAEEYIKYLEYLKSIDYITGDIERLQLEDLPGATGLKALRVEVNYELAVPQLKNQPERLLETAN